MGMVMRNLRTALLAGVAAIAVAGFAGFAAAKSPNTHVMTVQLPDGGVAQIRYSGDVAPQVALNPAPASLDMWSPAAWAFGPGSPFAALDRISAEMDREAAALFRQAQMLANQPPGRLTEAAARNLPPGTQSWSFVSTMTGNGVCTQSVEITTPADGGQPHVVRHSSGNCGSVAGPVALPPAGPPAPGPRMMQAQAPGSQPYRGLVREATWQR
jgi:hypothetical protein